MIKGYSTALFATWYFVEQFGILLDCGDGVCAGLMQKARKIKHIFVSHADRDHVAGLLQFVQLNGREGLTIHFPRDCGSFPALADFSRRFDPHVAGTKWSPMTADCEIRLRDNLVVKAIENRHVPTVGAQVKSLSFVIQSVSQKLRPEFQGLPGSEIAVVRQQRGQDAITTESRSTELIYSGDTPIETDGRYSNAKLLIHEATFLTRAEINPDNPKRNKHSSLDAVMEMVADSNLQAVILGHFSNRYSHEQIDEAIRKEVARCGVHIPIQQILPGTIASFH